MASQVTLQEQEQYWDLVVECMTRFLGYSKVKAQKEAVAFRISMRDEIKRAGGLPDLIYHEEPYTIACGIAGKDIDKANWTAYLDLKQAHRDRAKRKASLRTISRNSTAGKVVAVAKKTSKKIAK